MNGDNAEERIHHSDQPDHKSDDTLSVKIIRSVFEMKQQAMICEMSEKIIINHHKPWAFG